MADDATFPILRGAVTREEFFVSPKGGPSEPPALPKVNPKAHAQALLKQLDSILESTQRPDRTRDEEAKRELIAFRPQKGFELATDALASAKAGVRVVSFDEESGMALVDAPSAELTHLRRKIEAYASDARTKRKGNRKNEPAVAPLGTARLATIVDRAGPRFRKAKRDKDKPYWFELACRGGTRMPESETEQSRRELLRTLENFGIAELQEFVATERLIAFVRLTVAQLRELIGRTDCIYEFDLAGEDVRAWLLTTRTPTITRELQSFRLAPPPGDAPSVVVLDSGIVSEHPMLREALLSADSVVPGVSPEDAIGHGTLMAGVALFDDVGAVAEAGTATAEHWIQNAKILHQERTGTASEENRDFWPAMTADAITRAEVDSRPRVFAMAITAPMDDPPGHSSWSQALDQLAYNGGKGRLILVSIGDVDPGDHMMLAQGYPSLNLNQRIDDPAQATNVLTIGACTLKTTLPPDPDFEAMTCVAPEGGVFLFTRSGLRGAQADALKPDVVFEGGNAAEDGTMVYSDFDTLGALSTGHEVLTRPLVVHSMTSLATAEASRFAARLQTEYPDLRPETVRGLIVHSASWTPQMVAQFKNIDERISICGFGLPELSLASECVRERATVVVEDKIPNAVFEMAGKEEKKRRLAKFFRLPVPDDLLVEAGEVELRVTLSYFAEPNTLGRRQYRGLDLAWDMQGPSEEEDQFRRRINKLVREKGVQQKSAGSFDWTVGIQRRSHSTVQSDRWVGDGSMLAGSKGARTFTTVASSQPPSMPSGTSPGSTSSPGPTTSSSIVTLSWNASAGATSYGLGVRDLGTNTLVVNTDVTGTSHQASLSAGKQYRWNVNACNAAGCSDYTTPLYFQTPSAVTVPAVPSGTSPGSTSSPGPTTSSSSVTLSWNASTGATSYGLGVRDLVTNTLVVDRNVNGTSYTANLSAGRPYRWNVNACNNAGCSNYTTVLYFRTP